MHEVALHAGHNNYDFQPPYTEETLHTMKSAPPAQLTAGHIDSLSTCLASAHVIFDSFLSIPADIVRNLPVFLMVRLIYAAVVLIKMSIDSTVNGSVTSKILKVEDFRIEEYLGKVASLLSSACEGDRCQSAAKFKMVMIMLRTLFHKHTVSQTRQSYGSSQSISTKGGDVSDESTISRPNILESKNTGLMPSEQSKKRSSTSLNDISGRDYLDQSPHTTGYSSVQGSSEVLGDVATTSVEGQSSEPFRRVTENSGLDTLMADSFDFNSMTFDMRGENFSSAFVDEQFWNSVLDNVPSDHFNNW